MKQMTRVVTCIFMAAASSTFVVQAQERQRPEPPTLAVQVGEMAPDFSLRSHEMKTVKLSDFRGQKNVVLAFYVLAFTGG